MLTNKLLLFVCLRTPHTQMLPQIVCNGSFVGDYTPNGNYPFPLASSWGLWKILLFIRLICIQRRTSVLPIYEQKYNQPLNAIT